MMDDAITPGQGVTPADCGVNLPAASLTHLPGPGYMVPEERMTLEIERISNALFKVTTIQDVKKICAMAEALEAASRNLSASERVRKDAAILVIRAERRLGELSRLIPHGRSGRPGPGASKSPSRRKVLEAHDIAHSRAQIAEELAAIPAPEFDRALASQARPSARGVLVLRGSPQRKQWERASSKLSEVRAYSKLAQDAVNFVQRLSLAKRAPTASEARQFADRLACLERE